MLPSGNKPSAWYFSASSFSRFCSFCDNSLELAAGTLVDEISKTIPFLAIGQDIENVTYSRIGCLSIVMKMMFLCLQFPEPELIATYLICNVQINTDIAKAPLPTTATELLLYIWDGIRCVAHRQVFYSIIIPLCTGKEAIRSLSEGSQSLLLLSDTWKPNAHLSHYLRL